MKVNLVKQDEVEFNLVEDKCEKISHKTFRMLTGYTEGKNNPNDNPKMVVFKTKEEYQAEAYKYNLDMEKDILINPKGNIFCYLADNKPASTPNPEKATDEPADTK